jgi:UDP-GlcNAc3NAcA epimerase
MKLLTIVGARPQFIKAAAVGYAVEAANAAGAAIRSVLVHTGQHYDVEMSRVFFEELGLQSPDRDLGIGSGPHGAQTGRMLEAIEAIIDADRPDVVLVYGDTNSTLAGALAAAKQHVPVAHVEAGLRSFNRRMPEEVNRVLTDHVSRWLFCPTDTAVANLKREGIEQGVVNVGDVMYELVVRYGGRGALPIGWSELGIEPNRYVLATIHRAENTDDESRLRDILGALAETAADVPVMIPLHPRTQKLLPALRLTLPPRLHIVSPLPYGQMIAAEGSAALVVTDSGGVQKEAFWLGVPCVTARDETEWLETQEEGRNLVVGADRDRLVGAVRQQLARGRFGMPHVAKSTAASSMVHTLLRDAAVGNHAR